MENKFIKNKHAFTIKELIIVIAIILVVTVVTVPLVRLNYAKKSLYDKFRNAMMQINMSLNMSVTENDSIKNWDLFGGNNQKILNTYFKPYFTNAKTTKCTYYKNQIRDLNGNKQGSACALYNSTPMESTIVKFDQVTFGLHSVDLKNKTLSVAIDINGTEEPNMLGRDIFIFRIDDSVYEPVVPSGIMHQNCSPDLLPKTGVLQGEGCVDRLMTDGFMDY